MAMSSVFCDIKISNPVTGRVAAFSLYGDGDVVLPYVTDVNISMARGIDTSLSITLNPPYEDALELISKDNEWIRVGNILAIRWGYADTVGMFTDWHYGFMVLPKVSFGEKISISVQATGLAWNADRISRCRDWASEKSKKSFKEIAQSITERYGLTPVFAYKLKEVKDAFEQPLSSFVQGGRTDMQFMLYEAEARKAKMVIHNGEIIFTDPSSMDGKYPDVNATFIMYGQLDLANGIFPIDGFDSESTGTLFLKQLQGMASVLYGPNSDPEVDPVVVRSDGDSTSGSAVNNFSSKSTMLAPPKIDGLPPKGIGDIKAKTSVMRNVNEDECGRFVPMPYSGDEELGQVKTLVDSIGEGDAEDHGIVASFPAPAIPNLLPGMYVRIGGVGDYFSSVYVINTMDVSVSSGAAKMNVKVVGRGFPGLSEFLSSYYSDSEVANEPADGSSTGTQEEVVETEVD